MCRQHSENIHKEQVAQMML